ncbi:hypothetical protein EJ08DRAFT_702166 [Tothia fuscella]|uniref:Secreted protein n=1 Tax=Tothia fuscella TaxID=1048955 RepID=A0A9P4NH06_9PEZI|nr:hypothetical protein EJ08DRAFT_702166 [Tothia fuscella]
MKTCVIFLSTLLAQLATSCVVAHVRVDGCVTSGGPGRELGGTVWDNNIQVCSGNSIVRNPNDKPCLACRAGTSFCINPEGNEATYKNGGYSATLKSNALAKINRQCGGTAEKWGYADSVVSCLNDRHPSCNGDGGKPGCPTSQKLAEKGWNSFRIVEQSNA